MIKRSKNDKYDDDDDDDDDDCDNDDDDDEDDGDDDDDDVNVKCNVKRINVSGAFRLYDVDNDGYITRQEMYDIVDAIYQMVVSSPATWTETLSLLIHFFSSGAFIKQLINEV